MSRHTTLLATLVAVPALFAAACGGSDESDAVPPEALTTTTDARAETNGANGTKVSTTESPESGPPYALGPTRACLGKAGAAVSAIRSNEPQLRALGDVAQRTSLEVRVDGQTVGLAFGDTRLLASILVVPDDQYQLEVRRNALLMFRPAARSLAADVRACLRS